jgi:hypothetical protein
VKSVPDENSTLGTYRLFVGKKNTNLCTVVEAELESKMHNSKKSWMSSDTASLWQRVFFVWDSVGFAFTWNTLSLSTEAKWRRKQKYLMPNSSTITHFPWDMAFLRCYFLEEELFHLSHLRLLARTPSKTQTIACYQGETNGTRERLGQSKE